MLHKRLFKPDKSEILYHYCSGNTLSAIVENKTLRLSDINMMNDYNETGYGYGVFEEAANEMLADKKMRDVFPDFDRNVLHKIDNVVSRNQSALHPVIACFSKKPDVLSQWRGYADDARGFAIGFAAEALKKLPVSLLEIEYDRATQISEMKTALGVIHLRNRDSSDPFGAEFKNDCMVLANWMLAFKSEAFAEEQEVRCLHALTVEISDQNARVSSVIDTDDGPVPGSPVKFRTTPDGAFITFIDMQIEVETNPINEVWFGPKNPNGIGNLTYLLGNQGFANVKFLRSAATYR